MIVAEVPDASLVITSDLSLWTGYDVSDRVRPYRMSWAGVPGVKYVGAVPRDELIKIQSEAEFHLYPCTYQELFCISVAESQVAGAVPITSTTGALETTNRHGIKIQGNPHDSTFVAEFAQKVIAEMKQSTRMDIRLRAEQEFGLDRILDEWDKVFDE